MGGRRAGGMVGGMPGTASPTGGSRRAGGGRRAFYARMALGSLLRRRSRMLVALLAVAIGGTVLSGLTAVYRDIPRQMGQEFRSYGANLVVVPSGGGASMANAGGAQSAASQGGASTAGAGGAQSAASQGGASTAGAGANGGGASTAAAGTNGGGASMPEEALAYVRSAIPDGAAVGVAPYRYETVKINEQPFMAAGTDLPEARKASPYWFVSGQWPARAGEALVGKEIADAIRLSPGDAFEITGTGAGGEGFSYGLVASGIIRTGGAEEAFVFMSLGDFGAALGEGGYDAIECSIAAPADQLERIAAGISGAGLGAEARLVKRVTQSEGTVLTKLQSLVFLVTAIVLLLTMICVATTMMAVVAERRKEIGLRKALGAADRGIALEFLGEGVCIGVVGGLLGAAFGFVFAQAVSLNVFGRPIAPRPLLLLATPAAAALVTALACLFPVRRTMDIDPAVVLKGE